MPKNPGGRPKEPFPWDVIDALASVGASERYMAEYLLKSELTLEGKSLLDINSKMVAKKTQLIRRRIKERWGVSFVTFREQKQEDFKLELVQLQRKAAQNGKIAMQIWLGKQLLGQSDKMEERIDKKSKGEKREGPVILIPQNGTEQQN